jgi:PPOX class probable F420-dependent enzyme
MQRLAMTRAERERFLADTHVATLAVSEPDRGPCTVPVWYRYEAGGPVLVKIQRTSRKADLLRAAGRASLCAQVEMLPYRYVTVEGPVEIVATDTEADEREMAVRYLGARRAERYLAMVAADIPNAVRVLLHPRRWWSVDFSKAATAPRP